MITQETINRGGSKLEFTRAIIERRLAVPVPVSAWRYCGQDLSILRKDFDAMKKPVIVRGSHPNDYHGFIDVVPTERDVKEWSQLEFSVRRIERQIQQNPDVRIHCEDWGQPYIPEVHILLQEQSPSQYIGSMIRHPHTREIHIEWYDISDKGLVKNCADTIENNLIVNDVSPLEEVTEGEIKEIIEMYKALESTGLLDPEWAHQVEFGFKPSLFFQARPFKRFKPAESFEVPLFKHNVIQGTRECFGITPAEGIVLPFSICGSMQPTPLDDQFSNTHPGDADISKPYGLIRTGYPKKSYELGTRFGKLTSFCSPIVPNAYLYHGNYRLLKRAEFSVMDGSNLTRPANSKVALSRYKQARIISNGREMVVLPEG